MTKNSFKMIILINIKNLNQIKKYKINNKNSNNKLMNVINQKIKCRFILIINTKMIHKF